MNALNTTHYELEMNGLINVMISASELEYTVPGYYSYAICTAEEKEMILNSIGIDFDDFDIESNHLSRSFYKDGDVLFERDVQKILENVPAGKFIIAHSEDGFFELDDDFEWLPARFWYDGNNKTCLVFESIVSEFCLVEEFSEQGCDIFSDGEYFEDEIGSIIVIDYYNHKHTFKRCDSEFIIVLENDMPESSVRIENMKLTA